MGDDVRGAPHILPNPLSIPPPPPIPAPTPRPRGSSPEKSAFYAALLLVSIPAVLFIFCVCPYFVDYFGALVVVVPAYMSISCVVVLCIASAMDPGVIPPGEKENINLYIKNCIINDDVILNNGDNNSTTNQNTDNNINSNKESPDDETKTNDDASTSQPLIPPTNFYYNTNTSTNTNTKHNKKNDTLKVSVSVKGTPVTVRWCQTCHILRPPRASHCSDCDRCVLEFDHHCPWVGNCIAKRNYKFFMFFIYICTFLCLYVFGFSGLRIIWSVLDGSNLMEAIIESPVSTILVIYSFFIFWSVGILSGYHSWLVASGMTTNEELKGLFEEETSPYSKGLLGNFWRVWFSPHWPSSIKIRIASSKLPKIASQSRAGDDESISDDDEDNGVRIRKSSSKLANRSETAQLLGSDSIV